MWIDVLRPMRLYNSFIFQLHLLYLYLLQVIQVYLKWLDTNETMPIHQLVGFERVSLRAKETLSWLITVRAENMAVWNESRGFYIEPGKQKKIHDLTECPYNLN